MERTKDPEGFEGGLLSPRLLASVRDAGDLAISMRMRGLTSEVKSTKEDIVTEGDRAVSSAVRGNLSMQFPGIMFMDEELAGSETVDVLAHDLVAIIDPIDGTSNYYNEGVASSTEAALNPYWGISVGLVRRGEVCAGVIYQPVLRKLFYAEKGRGAFLNGARMAVSTTRSLSDARLIYDYPYPKDKREYDLTARVVGRLGAEVVSMEKLGSQVIEAMEVAEGKRDIFMHLRTKPWDVAAAIAIVTEAGGNAMDSAGAPYALGGPSILLTNGVVDIAPLTRIVDEERDTDS
ncbi:hypothetical protein A2765_00680 [Candidatus Kaiserbacteria bacterium RIFCSPHIGHO2_01_FULL_56_24]|uniref:Inositol-phosphate phosphatase n=1 Tax=Candidatus Kaiserbacteria bacterium RIFCSPHIGHO2_01_FULL_56_24 TaxID=1798487 RepID=A0A1F6DBZ3_9BACT|nr:MAG: hypothetical protein A2765_00680 [Candidatus Kaiserbacteria bacterium RIFCSPHIGHO2_01_FULL_56_24]